MSDLANGALVQHSTLGVGKIVALERDAVHVFFPAAEQRFATKLRLPNASAFLRTDGFEPDPWLQGLSAFTLDPESRRWGLAPSWLTHDQAIAQFLATHPEGFAGADDEGGDARPARWRAGHRAWLKAFGDGQGDKLVKAGDLGELTRRMLSLERTVRPLLAESEADALTQALRDPDAAGLLFERLFELVSVPSPVRARFDRLFAAAVTLAASPEAAWIVATLPPFLANPERHVLVRPSVAREAASRLGCDVAWDGGPNWATYSALRAFSLKLLGELRERGARDLADVEWFLHVTGSGRGRAKAKGKVVVASAAVAKPAAKPAAKPQPAPHAKAAPAKSARAHAPAERSGKAKRGAAPLATKVRKAKDAGARPAAARARARRAR